MQATTTEGSQSFIQPSELVVTKTRDGMSAGGFKIDSVLMAAGTPCATVNSQKGGSMLEGLKGLAVPAGLLFLQRTMANNYIEYQNKDAVIDEGLYDKLVNLASASEKKPLSKKSKTKKQVRKSANKRSTRRSK